MRHLQTAPGQSGLAQRQHLGRLLHLRLILAQNQQQLRPRHQGVIHHAQGRLLYRWEVVQKVRAVGIGGNHNRRAQGQLIFQHRQLGAPVRSQRPQPARHGASGFELALVGAGRIHNWHLHRAAITGIKKRCWQQGQVRFQGQAAQRQIQPTLATDFGPQAGMLLILTFQGVVPDELKLQTVVIGKVGRGNVQLHLVHQAQALFGQHNGLDQLVVERHLQVRQIGQQRRGEGKLQTQTGQLHLLIAANAQAHADFALRTAQAHHTAQPQILQPWPPVRDGQRRLPLRRLLNPRSANVGHRHGLLRHCL